MLEVYLKDTNRRKREALTKAWDALEGPSYANLADRAAVAQAWIALADRIK